MKYDKIKGTIGYNDLLHRYEVIATKKKYTSCTTLLGKFKEEFDEQKMSFFCAKRDVKKRLTKLSIEKRQQELLAEWKLKNKTVCDYGTRLHYALEIMLQDKLTIKETKSKFNLNDTECIYLQYVVDLRLHDDCDLILEDLLFSHEYEIAGQSDVVRIKDSLVHIDDWKFNSKFLDWESYKDKTFLKPLTYRKESKLDIYELQLSIYMYLKCEETGLEPGTMQIHHFLDGICTTHKFKYNKEEVIKILDYEKNNS